MSELRKKTSSSHQFLVSQVKRKVVRVNPSKPITVKPTQIDWLEEESCDDQVTPERDRLKRGRKEVGTRQVSPDTLGDEYSLIFNHSYPWEESPFSKMAKTARKDMGLKYIGLDEYHSPNSSGEVDMSRRRSSASNPNWGVSNLEHEPSTSKTFSFGNIFMENGASKETRDRESVSGSHLSSWNETFSLDVSVSAIQSSTQGTSLESSEELESSSSCGSFRISTLSSSFLRDFGEKGEKNFKRVFTSTPMTNKGMPSLKSQEVNTLVDADCTVIQSKERLLSSSNSNVLTPSSQREIMEREPSNTENSPSNPITAVFHACGQLNDENFSTYLTERSSAVLEKIGEGAFSEVFLFTDEEGKRIIWKVQPFEGDQIVNGGHQKKSADILAEILISRFLSDLRMEESSMTECFIEVKKFKCVHGPFPELLLSCWKKYDEEKGSENDCPSLLPNTQLFLITEMEYAGVPLEDFVFASAPQALSIFKQVAYALAVAENAMEFEHRDLHWGNIMVAKTTAKEMTFLMNEGKITLETRGVVATIVDYSLSRASIDGHIHYADLAEMPDIFESTGEYQFEIYRLMKQHNNNKWENFTPYTNVLWLHYIILQMLKFVHYKNTKAKIHKEYMKKIKAISSSILEFKSAEQYVCHDLN